MRAGRWRFPIRPLRPILAPVKTKEFLERERSLAERFGVRKTDAYYQLVRCPACAHEALLRSRFSSASYTSIGEVEAEMLQHVQREVRATCARCAATPLRGDGSRHVYLLYSERARAHLGVTMRLGREDDRVKVTRQAWWVPLDGTAVEIEDAADPRLESVWADSWIRRWSLDPDPSAAAEALLELTAERPVDALAWRELGRAYQEAGEPNRAIEALRASLERDAAQADVLERLGRLLLQRGAFAEAAEQLVAAFDVGQDPRLLPDVIAACYRGQRIGALAAAAEALLELDPDHLVGHKARVCVEDASNIGAWRDAWEDLRDAAASSGERYTEQVASGWMAALELPLPDWSATLSPAAYARAIADECEAAGLEVERDPDPLAWGTATLPIDLEVVGDDGTRWLVWLCDHEATPATDQTLAVAVRAARQDARRAACRILPLARTPLSYSVCRWTSAAPDAELDLDADADTTMQVSDENVAAFVQALETRFGRTLDFTLDSLPEVDAVLERYYDDGFGAMTFAFRCQAAAYLAQVLAGYVPGTSWVEADTAGDPYVLALPSGGRARLVQKVTAAVERGPSEPVSAFVQWLVRREEAAAS